MLDARDLLQTGDPAGSEAAFEALLEQHPECLQSHRGLQDARRQLLGADALQAECRMKGYINDMDEITETIGDRMTLFANIDPFWCLEKATDQQLADEIVRQVHAGRKARGFILSPASPITPGTPLVRVQRFIDLCHEIGRPG